MAGFRLPWHRPKRQADLGGAVARAQAEANLRVHQEQRVEVFAVAQRLRELRERNHFAEQFDAIIRKGTAGRDGTLPR